MLPALALVPSPVTLLIADEDDPLPRLRAAGGLRRIRHRVYCSADAWAVLPPWERYSARVRAYSMVHPEAVLCLESAAVLLGLPIFGEPSDIHVLDQTGARSHRRGDVVHHTHQTPREIVAIDGVRMTTPIDTTVELAAVVPPAFGLAVADALVAPSQLGAATVEQFRSRALELSPRRGSKPLAWVSHRADPRSESPGESVSRAVIEWLGFPAPVLQQTFHYEGHDDRGDFWWGRYGVLGESDGYAKYADPDPEHVRRKFLREKRREDRLRRHLPAVTRWGWQEALSADPVGRRLSAAGLPVLHSRNDRMLATLAAHPRSRRRDAT